MVEKGLEPKGEASRLTLQKVRVNRFAYGQSNESPKPRRTETASRIILPFLPVDPQGVFRNASKMLRTPVIPRTQLAVIKWVKIRMQRRRASRTPYRRCPVARVRSTKAKMSNARLHARKEGYAWIKARVLKLVSKDQHQVLFLRNRLKTKKSTGGSALFGTTDVVLK